MGDGVARFSHRRGTIGGPIGGSSKGSLKRHSLDNIFLNNKHMQGGQVGGGFVCCKGGGGGRDGGTILVGTGYGRNHVNEFTVKCL